MELLGNLLVDVFPALEKSRVGPALRMGDIPSWDSMSSLNLLMLAENTFKVRLRGVHLHDDVTVADLAEIIRRHGAQID